jgi:hypothetical protein
VDDGHVCAGCSPCECFVDNHSTTLTLYQVRAKMLQASSRAGLLKALGAGNFKHDWFATSVVG